MSDYTYLSAADTAKLIRTQLKKYFPSTKFWVNSKTYSGGASIDIDWIDGPTADQVKKIADPFSGAGFDGMNDYKTTHKGYLLPDGSAAFAEVERDLFTTDHYTKPHPDAKLVHFGADYIFENRHLSPEFAKPIIERICSEYGKPLPTFYESNPWLGGKKQDKITVISWDSTDFINDHWLGQAVRDALNIDVSNSPAVVTVDPQLVPQEEVSITWDRAWTWIKFPEKPSEAVRDLLKSTLNARYSARRNAWYVTEQIAPDTIRIQLAAA
jgi:hypothetical protein